MQQLCWGMDKFEVVMNKMAFDEGTLWWVNHLLDSWSQSIANTLETSLPMMWISEIGW
jgi:hypothetical protein